MILSRLIVIPTPIGNLEDISKRCLDALKSVDFILAEDTRHSGNLLKLLGISKSLKSYHKFNEHRQLESFINEVKRCEKVGLITDAGTPGISDPGFLIIRECIKNDIEVECLPGPTAFVPALILSGFSSERFCFEGFLPVKKGRKTRLEELAREERTVIFYESPYRILKTLEELSFYFGSERRISLSRELTKKFEETIRGTVFEVMEKMKIKTVKGEFVLVVEGLKK